ncbi:hypothetical protein PHJA_001516800 [Phtheirospermum japonicum]|uniref:Uncharacterized protein n=1 Tax=Phtheirospermum japonicum TaxID=374723 RepID=A0A830CBJ5_9LAMI|nr:hypothetical protein PHJA_001516800 [Phtheirospermum japonicum]
MPFRPAHKHTLERTTGVFPVETSPMLKLEKLGTLSGISETKASNQGPFKQQTLTSGPTCLLARGQEARSSLVLGCKWGREGAGTPTPPPSPLENVIPIPTPAGILVTLAPTPTSNTQSPAPVRIPAGRTLSQSPYPPLQNPAISYPFPSPSPLGRAEWVLILTGFIVIPSDVVAISVADSNFFFLFQIHSGMLVATSHYTVDLVAPYKTAQTLILTRRRHYFHQWTKSEFFWASLLLTNGFSKFAIESQDGTRSRMSQRSSHLKSRTIHEFVKA